VVLETSSAKVKNQQQEKQFVVFNLYGHSIEGNYVLVLQLPMGRIVILIYVQWCEIIIAY